MILCFLTLRTGIHFIMESAGIADGIVNSLALSFIVSIPGVIINVMASRATRTMMERLEHYREDRRPHSCFHILSKHLKFQKEGDWRTAIKLLPIRFIFSLAVTFIFIAMYLVAHCTKDVNGRWVSRTMYLPTKVNYDLKEFMLNAFLP